MTKTTKKSLYKVSKMTKNTDKNLWVAFPVGKINSGLVYNSFLSRDTVRSIARKELGAKSIAEIRSCRVSTYRKRTK